MLVIRPLKPELQEIAITELNENPNRIEESVLALRSWIKKQPHLKVQTTDQFLVSFLRGCKYNISLAETKINKFYILRAQSPELLKLPDVDDPKVRELIRCGLLLYLPTPWEGRRIVIIRTGCYPAEKFSFADVARLRQIMQQILMLEDDRAVVCGLNIIMDFGQVTAAHFFQASPQNMKKLSKYTEEAVPLRVLGTHFIDTPIGFETAFNLMKMMVPQQKENKLYVHGYNRESLYQHIPKKILPKDYGGENSSIAELTYLWEQKINAYRDYFKVESLNEADLSLCPHENAGIMGSFKSFFNIK